MDRVVAADLIRHSPDDDTHTRSTIGLPTARMWRCFFDLALSKITRLA
jgi:hypothetical protein